MHPLPLAVGAHPVAVIVLALLIGEPAISALGGGQLLVG